MQAKEGLVRILVYLLLHQLTLHMFHQEQYSSLGLSTYDAIQMEARDVPKYHIRMVQELAQYLVN